MRRFKLTSVYFYVSVGHIAPTTLPCKVNKVSVRLYASRGDNMSAHLLLNFLNELRKRDFFATS